MVCTCYPSQASTPAGMLRTLWSIFSEQKRDSLVSFQRAATNASIADAL